MNFRQVLLGACALAATSLLCASAEAQLFRAYLASSGSDANPCTLQQPCRLLPAALTAVASGGEIWMLDSANYNTATVSIGKSVSILAVPGAVGSVLAIAGPAISLSSSTVSLRNLVIVASSGATNGVDLTGGGTLMIENSVIANMPGHGVSVDGLGGGFTRARIVDSIIKGSGNYAVAVQNGAHVDIVGTKMLANSIGGLSAQSTVASTTTASMIDSVILGGSIAVNVMTTNGSSATRVFLTRCAIEDSADVLSSQTSGVGTSVISVSGTMITRNNRPWYQSGAGSIIRTLGDNHITDNNFAGVGAVTMTALQ